MESILVGVDGTVRGERAVEWAARRALREGARLTLLAVVSPQDVQALGVGEDEARTLAEDTVAGARDVVVAAFPDIEVATEVVVGEIVDSIVEAADRHGMVVLGSHHGATIGETVGGAKGLRVSVSTKVPTVVVPADWNADEERTGVVVGVGPDEASEGAIAFGVAEALTLGQPLELVSAWGLPPMLSRPAEVMGGGLAPVGAQFQANLDARVAQISAAHPELAVTGNAIEGPSPTRVLADKGKECGLLVLGTHSRTALGRTLFGSVTHGVLLDLSVPTCIVPTA